MGEISADVNQPNGVQSETTPSSHYVKKIVVPGEWNLTDSENHKLYSLKIITDSNDPSVADVYNVLTRTFSSGEVDPLAVFQSSIDGKTQYGTETPKLILVAVRDPDKKDKVVAHYAGVHLPVLDKDKKPTNKSLYMVGFTVTDPDYRRKGLASEAFWTSVEVCKTEAKQNGTKLAYVTGGVADKSEGYVNSLGRRRVYCEVPDDSPSEYVSLQEVPWIQPALDYNTRTGIIKSKAANVPEHLMVGNLLGEPITKDEVTDIVRSMYAWFYWPREAFKSDEAWIRHRVNIDDLLKRFETFINQTGNVHFLSKKDRQKLELQGVSIINHSTRQTQTRPLPYMAI